MPRVVDAFLFYNEVELLEYRLDVLWDVVDLFVITEATLTFTGRPKAIYFDKTRYAKQLSKIVHVVVEDVPRDAPSAWTREAFQRDNISRGFQGLERDDVILLSDVDEIPNPEVLAKIRDTGLDRPLSLRQHMQYQNFETLQTTPWQFPKVIPQGLFVDSGSTLTALRSTQTRFFIPDGGWHCSYFGTPQFIQNKIQNFSHQEFNHKAYTDLGAIQRRIQNHTDLQGRPIRFTKVSYTPGSPIVPPRSDWLLSLFHPPLQ